VHSFILWHEIAVTVTGDGKWNIISLGPHRVRRGVTWGVLSLVVTDTAIMKSWMPLVVYSQPCNGCNCRLFTKCTACGTDMRTVAGHLLVGGPGTAENENGVVTLQSTWMNEVRFDIPLETQWVVSKKLQWACEYPRNFIYFSLFYAVNAWGYHVLCYLVLWPQDWITTTTTTTAQWRHYGWCHPERQLTMSSLFFLKKTADLFSHHLLQSDNLFWCRLVTPTF